MESLARGCAAVVFVILCLLLPLAGCQSSSSPAPPDVAEMRKADEWLRERDEKMLKDKAGKAK